jgi:hypothetical protein
MIVDKINIQDNYENSNSFKSDNKRELMSDTFQIGQDLVTEIQGYWDSYGLILKSDVSIIPVVDETPDKVCGWLFTIPFTLRFINCDIPASPINPITTTPIPTTTPTATPTPTPTPTPSPVTTYQYFTNTVTGITSQQVLVECWDTFWNIGPGNNLCNWTGSVSITGSTGTIVTPTITFPIGQQSYLIDVSSGLGIGETIVDIGIFFNVSIPCPNYIPNFI